MKILVAEDDTETGEYIRNGLSGEGHSVDHVPKGREALTQALTQNYDLFIIDRMMPDLDGMSLLKSLRSVKINAPAIFLTALGSLNDKVEGLVAGADDHCRLGQPVDQRQPGGPGSIRWLGFGCCAACLTGNLDRIGAA